MKLGKATGRDNSILTLLKINDDGFLTHATAKENFLQFLPRELSNEYCRRSKLLKNLVTRTSFKFVV